MVCRRVLPFWAGPILVTSELDDGRVTVALDRHHLVSVRTVELAFFRECAVCVAFKSDFRHDVPVILVTGTTEPLSESSVGFHCRQSMVNSLGTNVYRGCRLHHGISGSLWNAKAPQRAAREAAKAGEG